MKAWIRKFLGLDVLTIQQSYTIDQIHRIQQCLNAPKRSVQDLALARIIASLDSKLDTAKSEIRQLHAEKLEFEDGWKRSKMLERELTTARETISRQELENRSLLTEAIDWRAQLTAAQERVKVLEASQKPTVADLFRRARAAKGRT